MGDQRYRRRNQDATLTLNTGVACAALLNGFMDLGFLIFRGKGTRNFFLGFVFVGLGWCHGFGGAVDDLAALHKSLDQPVIGGVAKHTFLHALSTEIEVTLVADAAMPVNIRDSGIAIVAADCERCARDRELLICTSKQSGTLLRHVYRLVKQVLASREEGGC